MTTAPSTLVWLQDNLVATCKTTNLGIVGDARHVRTGGYHIGARSLRRAGMGDDYSLRYDADRDASHDYACAIDIGGSAGTLMLLGDRLVNALRAHDPRVYNKVRGTNAPFDGQAIDRRYDTHDPTDEHDCDIQSSKDRNHIHLEVYRTLVLDQSVVKGIFDVLSGVPLHVTPPKPATPDLLEWIMSLPGAPAGLTYQQLIFDIGTGVINRTLEDSNGEPHFLETYLQRIPGYKPFTHVAGKARTAVKRK